MIKQYGMSDAIGQVYHASAQKSPYLLPGMEGQPEYSEATAELIDAEVRDIISNQYQVAKEVLEQNRAVVEQSAMMLLDKETITGEDLKVLMKDVRNNHE